MSRSSVQVLELAAWGFDDYAYRPAAAVACVPPSRLSRYTRNAALLESETELHHAALQAHADRTELLEEMRGLQWSLGTVDLRQLIAFQRRLVLDPAAPQRQPPHADDWPGLIEFCFPNPNPTPAAVSSIHNDGATLTLTSRDPNLQVRLRNDTAAPLQLHCGSPFVEAALYRERWFLRDGYHRAYALLRNGVSRVPAVVVYARSLEELGATQPWFFSEEVLFSTRPPLVADFLDEQSVVAYDRAAFVKTIRVTIEETFAPATSIGETT